MSTRLRLHAASAALFGVTLALRPGVARAASGDPLTPELRVNRIDASSDSLDTADVARSAAGLTVVVWTAIGDSANPPRPAGNEITVSEARINNDSKPVVAMNAGGSFAVAWRTEYQSEAAIAMRPYGPDGTPRSAITRVSTAATSQVTERSDIAMDDGGRVTVAFQPPSFADIRIRQFDAAGVALSDRESVVSDGDGDFVDAPVLAAQPAGDFVLGWHRVVRLPAIPVPFAGPYPIFISPQREEIRFRRFAANGLPKAASTVVDQAFSADPFLAGGIAGSRIGEPGIGVDADGDVVVAWPASTVLALDAIRARRYDAAGRPVGSIVTAGPLTSRTAAHVAVSSSRAGDVAVSWKNDGQVLARRYRADGRAAGPAFMVNPIFASGRGDPSRTAVTHDAAGNFGIVWTAANFDVLLRLYEGP